MNKRPKANTEMSLGKGLKKQKADIYCVSMEEGGQKVQRSVK